MQDAKPAPDDQLWAVPKRRSLSEEVFLSLRDAISDGEFPPGAPLRETALAKDFGVSATPVREALRRLEREGLVTSRSHHGTIVAEMTPATMAQLYELHETLEAHAVRRATEQGPHDLSRLHEFVHRMDDHLAPGDQARFNQLDLRFHRTLNELGGNLQIAALIEQTHRRIQAFRLRLDIGLPDRPLHSQAQHRALLAAIQAGNATEAERIARDHIDTVRTAVLATMKGDVGPG
jgi:DNA-binding GntR family transcriptional regulator